MTEEEMDEWLRKAGIPSDEGASDNDDDEEEVQLNIGNSSAEESDGPPQLGDSDPEEEPRPSTSAGYKLTSIEKVLLCFSLYNLNIILITSHFRE